MTHNFRTGPLRKKVLTLQDKAILLHNPTGKQLSFLHEAAHQHLGGAPTPTWGNQKIPVFVQAHPETLAYVREACRHPPHEFARRMTNGSELSKKGAGWVNGLWDGITSAAGTVGRVVADGARYAIAHQEQISSGLRVASDIANTAGAIAGLTGIVSGDTASKIQQGAAHVAALGKKYGKKKKPPAKTPKEGSGWVDYAI